MRIIKTNGFWTVNGVASFTSIEAAADIAIDVLREQMQCAPTHTLWTQYPVAA